MGTTHDTRNSPKSSAPRRRRWRSCLRKGCGRKFFARVWNQRYCQDLHCLRQVRRWLAAKRQERRRSTEEGKKRHREAESLRRAQRKAEQERLATVGAATAEPSGAEVAVIPGTAVGSSTSVPVSGGVASGAPAAVVEASLTPAGAEVPEVSSASASAGASSGNAAAVVEASETPAGAEVPVVSDTPAATATSARPGSGFAATAEAPPGSGTQAAAEARLGSGSGAPAPAESPALSGTASAPESPLLPGSSPPRGHAAKRKSGDQLCDRPGCWNGVGRICAHSLPGDPGVRQRRFCEKQCRSAVYRVEDRERKWRQRHGFPRPTRPPPLW